MKKQAPPHPQFVTWLRQRQTHAGALLKCLQTVRTLCKLVSLLLGPDGLAGVPIPFGQHRDKTGRHTDTQTHRHTDTHTHRHTHTHTHTHTDTDTHTDTHTHMSKS